MSDRVKIILTVLAAAVAAALAILLVKPPQSDLPGASPAAVTPTDIQPE